MKAKFFLPILLIPLFLLCIQQQSSKEEVIPQQTEWIYVKEFYSNLQELYPGEETTVRLTLVNTYTEPIDEVTVYLFGGGDIEIVNPLQEYYGKIYKNNEISFLWTIKAPEVAIGANVERYLKARINYTLNTYAWKDVFFYTQYEEVYLDKGYSYGPLEIDISLEEDKIRFYKDEVEFIVNFRIRNVGNGKIRDSKLENLTIVYPSTWEAVSINEEEAEKNNLLFLSSDGNEKILILSDTFGYYYSTILGYNDEKEFQIKFRRNKSENAVERIKVYAYYNYIIYTDPIFIYIKGS